METAFPQNIYTSKVGEITVFFTVNINSICGFCSYTNHAFSKVVPTLQISNLFSIKCSRYAMNSKLSVLLYP